MKLNRWYKQLNLAKSVSVSNSLYNFKYQLNLQSLPVIVNVTYS